MASGAAVTHRSGSWRVWAAIGAVVAAGAMLPGCTGDEPVEAPPTTAAPAASPTPSVAPTAGAASPEPVQIDFEFRRPDPACPPASALERPSFADQHPFELVNSYEDDDAQVERFGHFSTLCSYQRADAGGRGEDMILEDHVTISTQMRLYRRWEGSPYANLEGSYEALPVQSDRLDDWQIARGVDRERDWWEGCGEETPCGEGEEPTVKTRALHVDFTGHVGNLEFNVTVTYIAQRFPADVEVRTVEIFRDFVLAAMEGYEPVDG